ncbi:MAG: polysaccharide biosynthesis/export family protein [Pseudomonadota bacterium]
MVPGICFDALNWLKTLVSAGAISLSASLGAAEPELRLASGDAVLFSIVGSPEFDQTATIAQDGMVQVPLAGPIQAQGKTLPELQRDIAEAIITKPFRITDADGEESWRRISATELIIDVASYRPIYVLGDVRDSGEYTFRPGMTVRQAVALAGGLGTPTEFPISEFQILNLASQRDAIEGDIEATRTTLKRLERDLSNMLSTTTVGVKPDEDADEAYAGVKAEAPANDLDKTAEDWLEARAIQRAITTSNTEVRIAQLENRLNILRELEQSQLQALEIETEELERAQTLVERGIAAASTVADARRVVLQISMQVLETSGEISRVELDLGRTADEFGLEQSRQQIDLLTQLGNERDAFQGLLRERAAIDRNLMLMGGGSLLQPEDVDYDFEVFRQGQPGSLKLDDMTSDRLMPGDVLEVTATVIAASD